MTLLRRIVHRGADEGSACDVEEQLRREAERERREQEAMQRVRERTEEFRAYAEAIRGRVEVIARERSEDASHDWSQ
jgi:hypothetical protein